MSQERNPFQLTTNDILDALRSSDFGSSASQQSRNIPTDYHNLISNNLKECFDQILSLPKNNTSVPNYSEDTYQYRLMNDNRSFNVGLGSESIPSSSGRHNVSGSSALEALQSYGPAAQSPVGSSQWSRDYDHLHSQRNAYGMEKRDATEMSLRLSASIQNQPRDVDSPMSSDASSKPFSSLNLNSVEEEDEYLYGDSNSLPEAPKPTYEDSVSTSQAKVNTGWSDDDDPYDCSQNELSSKVKNPHSIWDTRNRKPGVEKVSSSERTNVRNQTQEFSSSVLKPEVITLSPARPMKPDLNALLEKNSLGLDESKSKYRVAAELLRKKTVDSKLMSKKSSVDSIPESQKIATGVESSLALRNEILGSKSDSTSLPKNIRQSPRSVAPKFIDNIKNYITSGSQQKRSIAHEELGPDAKHLKQDIPKSFSPSRRSPYDLGRHRSPVHDSKHLSRYDTKYKSSESDRMRPSSYHSIARSPGHEYERRPLEHYSRHPEGHSRYSRSPLKSRSYSTRERSRSPGYYHARSRDRSKSPGRYRARSRDRSKSPACYRARSRSRGRSKSPRHYSSRDKNYDKSEKSRRTPDRHAKKKPKSRSHSSDSYRSFSRGSSSSSTTSSDDSSDDKNRNSTKKTLAKAVPIDKKKTEEQTKGGIKAIVGVSTKLSNAPFPSTENSTNLTDTFNLQDKTAEETDVTRSLINSLDQDKISSLINLIERSPYATQEIRSALGISQEAETANSSTFASSFVSENKSFSQLPSVSCPTPYPYSSAAPVPYVQPQALDYHSVIPSSLYSVPVVEATPSSSAYGPYEVPVQPVDPRLAISKNPVRGPSTLRPITVSDSLSSAKAANANVKSFSAANSSNLSKKTSSQSPELSSIATRKPVKSSSSSWESKETSYSKSGKSSHEISKSDPQKYPFERKNKDVKGRDVEKKVDPTSAPKVAESTSEQNKILIIEKFKKMKAEKHLAHLKVNSAVEDIVEMRTMLDTAFGKKVGTSEKVIHSKCKNLLNVASDCVTNILKDAKRVDEDLNRFKAKLPTALQTEVSKIKAEQCVVEESQDEITYSCFDTGDHICFECNNQFKCIADMMSHIQSPEHKQRVEADKNWLKHFKKEAAKEDTKKSVRIQAAKGIEFMKPLTGFYCTLCKETVVDNSSAEQHVKSHEHFLNYSKFTKENPLYERKCLFKRYLQITANAKQKRMMEIEKKKEKLKQEEAAEKRVKEMIQHEKDKEKEFTELEEDSEHYSTSSNQKSANIKINLSSEKDKGQSSEKSKSSKESESKSAPKYIYIGKAPNFKKPQDKKSGGLWYKKDSILNYKEEEPDVNIPLPNIIDSSIKTYEKEPEIKPDLGKKTSRSKDSNIPLQSSKSTSKQSEISDCKKSATKSKSLTLDQAVKNILCGSDSSVSLSEITLPGTGVTQNLDKPSSPIPMDIDNSQDSKKRPKLSDEEKDFFILGINKEDFKPLVIPVPPPSSMISSSGSTNTQTYLTSNAGHSTVIASDFKPSVPPPLDFSVPPPSIVSYQNSTPSVPLYGSPNNAQTMGAYPYQNTNLPPPVQMHSSPSNVMPVSRFSNPPPPIPNFRNPPPMLPYSNQQIPHQMPPCQYPNTNNFAPSVSYPNMNNYPPNAQSSFPSNASYQDTRNAPPMSLNNQLSTFNAQVSAIAVMKGSNQQPAYPPPGTCTDNSPSKVVPVSSQNKLPSPTIKSRQNLITIVPTSTSPQPTTAIKVTKSVSKANKASLQKSDGSDKNVSKEENSGGKDENVEKLSEIAVAEGNVTEEICKAVVSNIVSEIPSVMAENQEGNSENSNCIDKNLVQQNVAGDVECVSGQSSSSITPSKQSDGKENVKSSQSPEKVSTSQDEVTGVSNIDSNIPTVTSEKTEVDENQEKNSESASSILISGMQLNTAVDVEAVSSKSDENITTSKLCSDKEDVKSSLSSENVSASQDDANIDSNIISKVPAVMSEESSEIVENQEKNSDNSTSINKSGVQPNIATDVESVTGQNDESVNTSKLDNYNADVKPSIIPEKENASQDEETMSNTELKKCDDIKKFSVSDEVMLTSSQDSNQNLNTGSSFENTKLKNSKNQIDIQSMEIFDDAVTEKPLTETRIKDESTDVNAFSDSSLQNTEDSDLKNCTKKVNVQEIKTDGATAVEKLQTQFIAVNESEVVPNSSHSSIQNSEISVTQGAKISRSDEMETDSMDSEQVKVGTKNVTKIEIDNMDVVLPETSDVSSTAELNVPQKKEFSELKDQALMDTSSPIGSCAESASQNAQSDIVLNENFSSSDRVKIEHMDIDQEMCEAKNEGENFKDFFMSLLPKSDEDSKNPNNFQCLKTDDVAVTEGSATDCISFQSNPDKVNKELGNAAFGASITSAITDIKIEKDTEIYTEIQENEQNDNDKKSSVDYQLPLVCGSDSVKQYPTDIMCAVSKMGSDEEVVEVKNAEKSDNSLTKSDNSSFIEKDAGESSKFCEIKDVQSEMEFCADSSPELHAEKEQMLSNKPTRTDDITESSNLPIATLVFPDSKNEVSEDISLLPKTTPGNEVKLGEDSEVKLGEDISESTSMLIGDGVISSENEKKSCCLPASGNESAADEDFSKPTSMPTDESNSCENEEVNSTLPASGNDSKSKKKGWTLPESGKEKNDSDTDEYSDEM